MSRHYTSLWLLLLTAFIIFAVASAFDMPEVCGHKLKSSEIADNLFGTRTQAVSPINNVGIATAAETQPAPKTIFPVPCDTASQVILFIGDSMLEGLGPRMAAYAEANGHTLYNVIWYSSTSEVWGKSDKLEKYIKEIKPTYILISLGANELFVSDIAKKRDGYVKKILADIGTIPYLWIGPPNWKPDTGINDLVAANAPEGAFFLSNGMHFDRAKDGAHPTHKSAAAWLDSIVRWMPDHALHPIKMDIPAKATGKAKRIFVHQPSEH